MKINKMMIILILLSCISGFMCGCSSRGNDSYIIKNANDSASSEYVVTTSEDKIVYVFTYTEDGGYAEKVTATLLSGEQDSMIYEFEEKDGIFLLSTLDEGIYEIAASCAGYETDTRIIIIDDSSLYILRMDLQTVQE